MALYTGKICLKLAVLSQHEGSYYCINERTASGPLELILVVVASAQLPNTCSKLCPPSILRKTMGKWKKAENPQLVVRYDRHRAEVWPLYSIHSTFKSGHYALQYNHVLD